MKKDLHTVIIINHNCVETIETFTSINKATKRFSAIIKEWNPTFDSLDLNPIVANKIHFHDEFGTTQLIHNKICS